VRQGDRYGGNKDSGNGERYDMERVGSASYFGSEHGVILSVMQR